MENFGLGCGAVCLWDIHLCLGAPFGLVQLLIDTAQKLPVRSNITIGRIFTAAVSRGLFGGLAATSPIIGPIASKGKATFPLADDVLASWDVTLKLPLPWIIFASYATFELPEAGPSTMSTPWILRRLYTLDPSLDFSRHLYSVFRHDEEEKYFSKLRGSELAQLLDFFDKVRAFHSILCPAMWYALQALDTIPTTNYVARECLRKLQATCGHHAILPSSYIISDGIARVGDEPIDHGDITDGWEGTYHRNKVSIRCLRVPPNDIPAFAKVRVRCRTPLSRLLMHAYDRRSHSSKKWLCGKG